MFRWIIEWWNNTKPVILNFVLPKIDMLNPILVDYLNKEKTSLIKKLQEESNEVLVDEGIAWLKEYIKRQL